MFLLSWNVNGIRAAFRKGFADFLAGGKPDILCLQEVKISDKDIAGENFDFAGYTEYWHPAERPGYSGTAVLLRERIKPLSVKNGLGVKKFDAEGRVQTVELDKFYLVNAYFPNANHELSRLDFKLKFDDALLKYVKNLDKKKSVVICGDFNVAHQEIDLANPKTNTGNPGFTPEERAWVDKFIKLGYTDTFRHFYPDKVRYSWWSYRFNARTRNIGWRIDYFFTSKRFIDKVKKAFILDQVTGSDHCPVGINIAYKQ